MTHLFRMRLAVIFCTLTLLIPLISSAAAPDTFDLCWHHMPLRQGLLWLAEHQHRSVVLSPGIRGSLSLQLHRTSWKEVLPIILRTQGLAESSVNGIPYIAPLEEIRTSHQKRLEQEELKPLTTVRIPLHYGKAVDIAKVLKTKESHLLSEAGFLLSDERTNALFIRDTPTHLEEIRRLLKDIDIPLPQVLIEAHIVNLDHDCERELGVRLGATEPHAPGSLDGANSLANGSKKANLGLNPSWVVDLPAWDAHAGRLGLALAKLPRLLDLELSALENEGRAEILSNPRLLTSQHETATIEAGEEIPYQESSAQGVTTTSFKKAVLSLEVTPEQVTTDSILLHLKVNQDKRSNREILGVPSIDTRQIATHVVVGHGQTLILGGIYEETQTHGRERVPWFSDIPLVGSLFRHTKMRQQRRELLIFITPYMIPPT